MVIGVVVADDGVLFVVVLVLVFVFVLKEMYLPGAAQLALPLTVVPGIGLPFSSEHQQYPRL